MESSCSSVECVIVDNGLKTPNCKKSRVVLGWGTYRGADKSLA